MLGWFDKKWEEVQRWTVGDFIKLLSSGSVTNGEKARFVLRLAEEVRVNPNDLVAVQVTFKKVPIQG